MINWHVPGWKAEPAQQSPTSTQPSRTFCLHTMAQLLTSPSHYKGWGWTPSFTWVNSGRSGLLWSSAEPITQHVLSAQACHHPQSDKRLQGRPEGLDLQPPGSRKPSTITRSAHLLSYNFGLKLKFPRAHHSADIDGMTRSHEMRSD